MKFVICALVALAGPVHAAEERFDLECRGMSSTHKAGKRSQEGYNATLHIDLVSSQYCIDDCDKIYPVAKADPLEITLNDTKVQAGVSLHADVRKINRRTGEYIISYANSSTYEIFDVVAVCEAKPFTPFPATRF